MYHYTTEGKVKSCLSNDQRDTDTIMTLLASWHPIYAAFSNIALINVGEISKEDFCIGNWTHTFYTARKHQPLYYPTAPYMINDSSAAHDE